MFDVNTILKNADVWIDQIVFYRTHLDVFIEDIFGLKLVDIQKVMARGIGNRTRIYIVACRGFGKTLVTAACAMALAVLYPGSDIAVASKSVEQANGILEKILSGELSYLDGVMREVDKTKPNNINKNGGVINLKNGSTIKSYSVASLRGKRAKVAIIDEAPLVKKEDIDAVITPITRHNRMVSFQNGFADYDSKIINITSAPFKTTYFYEEVVRAVRRMGKGVSSNFAMAIDYKAAIRTGIEKKERYDEFREGMSQTLFDMEHGSIFVGSEVDSVFSYDLIESCRTLRDVEYRMPEKEKSKYIMSVDFALSEKKWGDNAVISVIKLEEGPHDTVIKKLVYIRSYHGAGFEKITNEIHDAYLRFPNIEKVIVDQNGPGESLPVFLQAEWEDPISGEQMPGWISEDILRPADGSINIVKFLKATPEINRKIASAMVVAFERKTIEIPVSSSILYEDIDEQKILKKKKERRLTKEEQGIFIETDALQAEMGTIVPVVNASGTIVTYDSARSSQKKDRYSSVGMAMYYLAEKESAKRGKRKPGSKPCIGVVSSL